MGFNYENSVNSNNNFRDMSDGNVNTEVEKPKKSIFSYYFRDNKELFEQADLNKDDDINTYEVRRWIERVIAGYGENLKDALCTGAKDAAFTILIKIANTLGVVYEGRNPEPDTFKKELIEELNNYQKIDIDKDGIVKLSELEQAQENLPKSVTATFSNRMGLVDGYIDNYQGQFGSCWLLSRIRGIAQKSPELYSQMIKQNKETGEVTVTIPGRSGEPFIYKISKEKLLELRKVALQGHRSGSTGGGYHSTDIDVIAFEKAFLALEDKENTRILSETRNYLDNSIILKPEKFRAIPLNEILSMSDEDIEATRTKEYPAGCSNEEDLHDFIKFTRPIDKNLEKPSLNRFDYDNYAEYIRTLADYITNVDYELDVDIEKFYNEDVILNPWVKKHLASRGGLVNLPNSSFSDLLAYVKTSQPLNGVEKPKLSYNQNNVSVRTGGDDVASFYMLLGNSASVDKYENGDLSSNKMKKVLEAAVQSENQVVCCNFKPGNESRFYKNHSYLIEAIYEKGVVLSNPHNAEDEIWITYKEFLELFEAITIATLPDKIF